MLSKKNEKLKNINIYFNNTLKMQLGDISHKKIYNKVHEGFFFKSKEITSKTWKNKVF